MEPTLVLTSTAACSSRPRAPAPGPRHIWRQAAAGGPWSCGSTSTAYQQHAVTLNRAADGTPYVLLNLRQPDFRLPPDALGRHLPPGAEGPARRTQHHLPAGAQRRPRRLLHAADRCAAPTAPLGRRPRDRVRRAAGRWARRGASATGCSSGSRTPTSPCRRRRPAATSTGHLLGRAAALVSAEGATRRRRQSGLAKSPATEASRAFVWHEQRDPLAHPARHQRKIVHPRAGRGRAQAMGADAALATSPEADRRRIVHDVEARADRRQRPGARRGRAAARGRGGKPPPAPRAGGTPAAGPRPPAAPAPRIFPPTGSPARRRRLTAAFRLLIAAGEYGAATCTSPPAPRRSPQAPRAHADHLPRLTAAESLASTPSCSPHQRAIFTSGATTTSLALDADHHTA